MLPGATEVGDAEFVATRSDCVAVATTSAAVTLLFAVFGSLTAELTLAVSLIAVPAAVPAVTVTTYVMVAGVLAARLGFVQVSVAGVQVHPAGPVRETKVVFAGAVSVKVTLLAVLGPALFTTCVYVMLLPACTGTGLGVLVTERSAELVTSTFTVTLLLALFGSWVDEETVSVCEIGPAAVVGFTVTTKVKFAAVVLAAIAAVAVQLRLATVHVHPAGPVSVVAVVPAGTVSLSVGALAEPGPLLVTLCVYVMVFPALTGFGVAAFVTLKSACAFEATAILTVAELFAGFVSLVVVATVAVSLMIVPAAAPAATVYFAVIVPVELGGTLGLVHATGAASGHVHVTPPLFTTATETNVVFAGVASLNVPVLQLLGPVLVTTCV